MALDAAELKTRLNEATNNLAGDVHDLKAKLEAALADQGVAIEAAVQEALTGFDELATNLENLASETPEDPTNEEPTPEPEPAPE